MRALAHVIALALSLGAAPGSSGPVVTLNGINIDGATNQRIENCTVVIDAQGNIDIQAKGYSVRRSGGERFETAPAPVLAAVPLAPAPPQTPIPVASAPGPVPPAPEKLTRRYFLATEQSQPDGTQYDVAVFINARWIRELKSTEDQVVTEVTKYLRPGANKVVLAATKRMGSDRHSYSREVTYKIILGEGNLGGDHVMIDNPLVEMKRTAAETDDVTEEFTLVAR